MSPYDDVATLHPDGTQVAIAYGSRPINEGDLLKQTEAVHAPSVTINPPSHQGSHQYTLVMVDPDAPSPDKPTNREWLHWIVANIPPAGGPKKGTELVPYAPPTPPMGTHRYIFLVFQQDAPVVQRVPISQRGKFKAATWAAEHHLGDTVAATYFKVAAGN